MLDVSPSATRHTERSRAQRQEPSRLKQAAGAKPEPDPATDRQAAARILASRSPLLSWTGLGLWPAILLFVGLASIGVAAGFVIGQHSFSARHSGSQADTSSLLLTLAATRDAQQVEIAHLGAELETARQALAAAQAQLSHLGPERSEGLDGTRPPLALILDAPLARQERSLSCESSAAAMAANFYGLPVHESDILNALPRHEDPNLGFRGNVDGPYGGIDNYGTYAEPIRQILAGLGLQVRHLDGGIDEIKQHIRAGRPVIAWVTYDMQAQIPRQVTLSDGRAVTMVPYQHVILVVGYNANGLWVHDPYDGTRTWYAEDDFRRSFAYLGNMALVVGPPARPPRQSVGQDIE